MPHACQPKYDNRFELLPTDVAVEGLLVELEVHPQGPVLRAHLAAYVESLKRWQL